MITTEQSYTNNIIMAKNKSKLNASNKKLNKEIAYSYLK